MVPLAARLSLRMMRVLLLAQAGAGDGAGAAAGAGAAGDGAAGGQQAARVQQLQQQKSLSRKRSSSRKQQLQRQVVQYLAPAGVRQALAGAGAAAGRALAALQLLRALLLEPTQMTRRSAGGWPRSATALLPVCLRTTWTRATMCLMTPSLAWRSTRRVCLSGRSDYEPGAGARNWGMTS